MTYSSLWVSENSPVCEQCKDKEDTRAPLRPLRLADLRRSRGKATEAARGRLRTTEQSMSARIPIRLFGGAAVVVTFLSATGCDDSTKVKELLEKVAVPPKRRSRTWINRRRPSRVSKRATKHIESRHVGDESVDRCTRSRANAAGPTPQILPTDS
jgi:hypothetical protein